ncbi:hypothetical protein OSTOST_14907 [Ostertagia ostertagi]
MVGIQSKLLLQLDTTHGLDSFAAYKASRIVMCPENAHVRKCPLNTEGPTLSEEFCRAELLHFRTKNHDMWTDLLYKKNLEISKKFTNDGAVLSARIHDGIQKPTNHC